MGYTDEQAFSSLRLSLSIMSTEEEVDEAVGRIVEVIKG
jgi:cysteine sulfinate desulfinase/cysteine desulfurase-like protein